MLNSYLTQIRMNLLLTLRNRVALFFSYIFPLIFFGFAGMGGGGGNPMQIVGIVLGLGVLGGGLFGVGIRAVQDREQNILRRFKVAPIGPGEIIVSGMVTALALQIPNVVFMVVLAHQLFRRSVANAAVFLAPLRFSRDCWRSHLWAALSRHWSTPCRRACCLRSFSTSPCCF